MRISYWLRYCLFSLCMGLLSDVATAYWNTAYGATPDFVEVKSTSGGGDPFSFNYLFNGGLMVYHQGVVYQLSQIINASFFTVITEQFLLISKGMPGVQYHPSITGLIGGVLAYSINNNPSSMEKSNISNILFSEMTVPNNGVVQFSLSDGLNQQIFTITVSLVSTGVASRGGKSKYQIKVLISNKEYVYEIEMESVLVDAVLNEKTPIIRNNRDDRDHGHGDDGAGSSCGSGCLGSLVSAALWCCSSGEKSGSTSSSGGTYQSTRGRAALLPVLDMVIQNQPQNPLEFKLGLDVLGHSAVQVEQQCGSFVQPGLLIY